jgi:Ca2+-dependent lipid-binding protein
MPGVFGIFEVEVWKAKELNDVQAVGKQDPYVVIETTTGLEFKTKAHNDGGANPQWGETFKLVFGASDQKGSQRITFTVRDENILVDKTIGACSFLLQDFAGLTRIEPQFHRLTNGGSDKTVGWLALKVKFTPGMCLIVHKVRKLQVVQAIGKQDPYVVISLGNQKVKTKVKTDAHQEATFEEKFFFVKPTPKDQKDEKETTFHVLVRDENVMVDEDIGHLRIKWSTLESKKAQKSWYGLVRGEDGRQEAGEILLSMCDYTLDDLIGKPIPQKERS